MRTLRLGTRGSPLALWQARWVADKLARETRASCELIVYKTTADRFPQTPVAALGGKRLFVKELEEALLAGQIDLAVHSAKDLPAWLPAGLALGAVPLRDDPHDALVLRDGVVAPTTDLETVFRTLGTHPRVGTGSIRRIAQLRRVLPQAVFAPLRGNLDTRVRKLDAGDCDALVVAAAGVQRLGLAHRIAARLPVEVCVPAPGQGALALEVRADDEATRTVVAAITDREALVAVAAERALVAALGGGCQLPVGALATVSGATLTLHAVVAAPDGVRMVRHVGTGDSSAPDTVGTEVARALLAAGAADILQGLGAPDPSRST